MIKVFGALAIIVATTFIGFEISSRLSKRPKLIKLFRDSLETLEAEIMYGHTPLGEAAQKIASQLPDPVSAHYRYFAELLQKEEMTVFIAWEEALKKTWKDTSLKHNEYEILLQFGANLGKHDRSSQQKQIMLTLSHLEREENDAREAQKKYENMLKSIGLLSGLLIVLLLL